MLGAVQIKTKGGPEDEPVVQEWHQNLMLCRVPKKRKQTNNIILTVPSCIFILVIYRLILAAVKEKFQRQKGQVDTLPWEKAYVSHAPNFFLVFKIFPHSSAGVSHIASPGEQPHLK